MIALKVFEIIMFGTSSIYGVISTILYIVGCWQIFNKCGLNSKYAVIPFYREYTLARCADCEREGRALFVCNVLATAANLVLILFHLKGGLETIILLVMGALDLGLILYTMRIYLRLCEIFGTKKIWTVVWMFFEWIPALLWGFSQKYQALWKVSDIQKEKEIIISGKVAVEMKEGMTVNLQERSVPDFLKKKYLLRDIHMNIKPGHMVLLLGGSGAGKTTLLNAMIGYEKAKASVVLNGTNVYQHYKKMQYEIGFVPQLDLMRGNDTVYNTLMDAAALRLPSDFSSSDRKQRVNEVMQIFGLTPVKGSQVQKLSGGQRKRLSIAMEFIPNPSLFILDEPDSGLDGIMARELMEQLRMIADQGKIVIVITHTPDRVIDLFDDLIVLAKDVNRTGRLAYFGPIEEAKEFFEADKMERIVMRINRQEEGGEGRADEFIAKYAEVQHG